MINDNFSPTISLKNQEKSKLLNDRSIFDSMNRFSKMQLNSYGSDDMLSPEDDGDDNVFRYTAAFNRNNLKASMNSDNNNCNNKNTNHHHHHLLDIDEDEQLYSLSDQFRYNKVNCNKQALRRNSWYYQEDSIEHLPMSPLANNVKTSHKLTRTPPGFNGPPPSTSFQNRSLSTSSENNAVWHQQQNGTMLNNNNNENRMLKTGSLHLPFSIPSRGSFNDESMMNLPHRSEYRSPSKNKNQQPFKFCVFCQNNGEQEEMFSGHILKDDKGRIICPILRAYTCPVCLAKGDNAHTLKYCPYAVKPWLLLKITLAHWASLPVPLQGRLSRMANETGMEMIEPVLPNTLLAALSRSPQYCHIAVSSAVKMKRKIEEMQRSKMSKEEVEEENVIKDFENSFLQAEVEN